MEIKGNRPDRKGEREGKRGEDERRRGRVQGVRREEGERATGRGRGRGRRRGMRLPCGRGEGRRGCVPGREGVMAVAVALSVQLALRGEGRVGASRAGTRDEERVPVRDE